MFGSCDGRSTLWRKLQLAKEVPNELQAAAQDKVPLRFKPSLLVAAAIRMVRKTVLKRSLA